MQGGTQEFKTIIGHNKHCNLECEQDRERERVKKKYRTKLNCINVKIKFIVEFAQNKARYVAMDLNIKYSIKSHNSFEEHEKKRKNRKYPKHKNNIQTA